MKIEAPAAERNKKAILQVLNQYLPLEGKVLDVASGSGTHVRHFAENHPKLLWQPSDPNPEARSSIDAHRHELQQNNILEPLNLDVRKHPWPLDTVDFIVNINMLHISPWTACEGLMKGSSQLLSQGQYLYIYGPFILADRETAPSNLSFMEWLKAKSPEFGIRELTAVVEVAQNYGLKLKAQLDMPANNCSVIFEKV